MSNKFTPLDKALYEYLVNHTTQPDDVILDLMKETENLGSPAAMQISQDQGMFLYMITKLMNAKIAIEVGTFTGFSSISIARGMPEDGRVITCDVSEEYTAIARRYMERAGVSNKIEIKMGPALDTLKTLDLENIDLAFIDGDKAEYLDYYEAILPKMRSGGLMIFDNVLWHGRVINSLAFDNDTKSIRDLNDFVFKDSRVEVVMLPIADGLSFVRKL